MRQCPQCNYIDEPIWRHKRYRLFTDYCTFQELKEYNLPLWCALLDAKIQTEKQVKIGHYIYHLTKAQYIDRIHPIDSLNGNSWREPEQEKSKLPKILIKGPENFRRKLTMTEHTEATKIINAVYCELPLTNSPCIDCIKYQTQCKGRKQK